MPQPENILYFLQVEETYRKVHDGQWGWRALRLLAKKSPYFFTYGNAPIGTLPKYLTTMLKKHYPEWDKSKTESGSAKAGPIFVHSHLPKHDS